MWPIRIVEVVVDGIGGMRGSSEFGSIPSRRGERVELDGNDTCGPE